MSSPSSGRPNGLRTLLVSDLHLGTRRGDDVLRFPAPRRRLIEAISPGDRLVLLGDTVELAEGRARRALAVAEPVLRAIGARVGSAGEVVLVPGNHDHALIRPWVRERRRGLGVADAAPLDASPTLARVVAALAPAAVRVSYPGVWPAPGIWATHGHYLDRHLLPEGSVGLFLRPRRDGPARPGDYEARGRPSLARATPLLPSALARGLDSVADSLRASTMPRVQRTVLQRRFAPVTSRVLGVQMRRSSLPALARVVQRLGVDSEWVVFGHVHRLGPVAGDDPALWLGPAGRPRIVNTGSWLYEPRLLHGQGPPHPYWPGGAVVIEDGGPPEPIGLLDDLSAADLVSG